MSETKSVERPAAKAKEQMYVINIAFGNDGEPKRVFVGANGRDFHIERGKDVTVPASVLEALDHAVKGVPEVDPNDDTKVVMVDRLRFPYTIVKVL